jgi:hypothetical protein
LVLPVIFDWLEGVRVQGKHALLYALCILWVNRLREDRNLLGELLGRPEHAAASTPICVNLENRESS